MATKNQSQNTSDEGRRTNPKTDDAVPENPLPVPTVVHVDPTNKVPDKGIVSNESDVGPESVGDEGVVLNA